MGSQYLNDTVNLCLVREFNWRKEKNLEVVHEYYRDVLQVQNILFSYKASYSVLPACHTHTHIIMHSCMNLFLWQSVKFLALTKESVHSNCLFDQNVGYYATAVFERARGSYNFLLKSD